MIQSLRVIRIGWLLQLKTMARSGFDVLTAIVTPITYATIAFFLYGRGGGQETLLWVSLGAAFMGLWASTLWGAGNMIQRQRSQQTLEFAIASPTPFLVSLIGTSLASSTVGLYSLVATLAWGRLLFDVPLEVAHPVLFALSLPAAILSLGLLGIVMAATLILYRYAWALANMLEYPVWLAAGLLVADRAPPGLGAPDLLRAGADLGREGRTRERPRRRAADRDRRLPRARRRLPRSRLLRRPELRAARAPARDAGAVVSADADVTSARIFVVGGVLSYRALFNWMQPVVYVPTMLGGPLFQILFFAYIGRASGVESDAFFVVGNAIQVSAMAGIFGVAMTIGGERWTQTLSLVLVSPANRFALFLGRALPLIVNGFILSAFGFVVGLVLLDFELEPSVLPALAACVLVTTASCTAFGFIIGSIGLYAREIFVAANLAYIGLLLFCGVNVPARRAAARGCARSARCCR